MMTAADIRNVDFSKTLGGYKIAEVEAFVESCAQTVEALTAEKEELAKKLGILADKLVEYRRDEDNIRSALLSAQRTGDTVIHEAEENAAKILADAQAEAENVVASAKKSITMYEGEIERLKKQVAEFKATVLALYKDHLEQIRKLPDADVPAVAPAAEKVVEPVSEVKPAVVVAPVTEPVVEPVVEATPVVTEETTTPRSKFANLKFGEDYSLADDDDQE